MDKRQLVDGCKRGDPASAEALYRDYSGKLMGICRQLFRICGRSGLEGTLRADAAGVEAELGVFPDASASGQAQEALLPQMRPVRRGGAGRGPQANASRPAGGRPWAPGQCVRPAGGRPWTFAVSDTPQGQFAVSSYLCGRFACDRGKFHFSDGTFRGE